MAIIRNDICAHKQRTVIPIRLHVSTGAKMASASEYYIKPTEKTYILLPNVVIEQLSLVPLLHPTLEPHIDPYSSISGSGGGASCLGTTLREDCDLGEEAEGDGTTGVADAAETTGDAAWVLEDGGGGIAGVCEGEVGGEGCVLEDGGGGIAGVCEAGETGGREGDTGVFAGD